MGLTVKRVLQIEPPANVTVKGWIKTCRKTPALFFIELTDGSTTRHLQVVADTKQFSNIENMLTLGQAVEVYGELVRSPAPKQPVELKAIKIDPIGYHDSESYPIQKKEVSLEFLREIAHLRARTNTIGSALRIRSAVSFAIHEFFQSRDFYYVHTPIITASDCEGAGEMFRVTTLAAGESDHNKDFFGRETFLTVSGQLEGEALALALGRIYTFGPTFRAENSNTTRHLAEFWMIEPEMAFFDLTETIQLAEDLLKHCVKYVLENCEPELQWLSSYNEIDLSQQLNGFLDKSVNRITYQEAIEILNSKKDRFEFKPEYGKDIQTEHERFLVDEYFQGAVAVTNYPKQLKPFYAYQNDDGTVNNFDLLMPRIGETIGGSQREHRLDKLLNRMRELNLDESNYRWYVELRRFGSVPHSGFGLGLERLMIYTTGLKNVRDTIPFPRYPGHADF